MGKLRLAAGKPGINGAGIRNAEPEPEHVKKLTSNFAQFTHHPFRPTNSSFLPSRTCLSVAMPYVAGE
jgi:hypothetical protein